MRGCSTLAACLVVGILACGTADAQYASDFEAPTFTGSPDGTIMTGQDAFYIPPDTVSTDFLVYTYAGNTLGVPDNPAGGGDQFVAGTGPAGSTFGRAQRDINWGTGIVVATYDVCCSYQGDPNAATQDNIGSFSNQPSSGSIGGQIHLFRWVQAGSENLDWRAFYLHYDANDVQVPQPGSSPGPEWDNLQLNHWYRFSTTFDFDINQIIEVSATDLETGATATHSPTDWYLAGGDVPGPPTITAFRFFAGGNAAGNTAAFDNLSIGPPGEPCPGDVDGDGDTDLADLGALLAVYGGYDPACDFDGDGDVDLADLAFLLSDYGCTP